MAEQGRFKRIGKQQRRSVGGEEHTLQADRKLVVRCLHHRLPARGLLREDN